MTSDLEELARLLQTATTAIQSRMHLWRVVIDDAGIELDRIYRGSCKAPVDEPIAETSEKEPTP